VVPIMEHGDLDFGEAMVKHSCDFVVRLARDHIADSKQEMDVKAILEVLRNAGTEWVSKTVISRRLQGIPARQRGEILHDLVQSEQIEMTTEGSGRGPKAQLFRLVRNNPPN
jgi:uncharacterized membrane-anchored protein